MAAKENTRVLFSPPSVMWIHMFFCFCCAVLFEIPSVVKADPWKFSKSFPGKCRLSSQGMMNQTLPGGYGFHIRISGNPEKYLPGELYTVNLEGYRFPHQSFIGFMLIVEPREIKNDSSDLPDVGSFKFFFDDLIKYSEECPKAIVHASLSLKHGIQVIWKAPKAGTGCVVFTAVVQEKGEVWHMDEGGLIQELCEEEEYAAGEEVSSSNIEPRGKCSATYCTCTEIPQWNGVECEDYNEGYLKRPILSYNRSDYLPGRMFQGLNIYSLVLRDPNVTVAENVLEGIIGLDKFIVYRSSIEVVPDLRFVKDSIRNVYITSSRLTSLEGKHLQNLTAILHLSFTNNFIRYIDPDVFGGTYNAYSLVLSHNNLTTIPPKLLNHMRNLEYFDASHNNLLHVDQLFAVARPLTVQEYEFTGPVLLESLFLQHNHIKFLGTLQQLDHLHQLNIAHNDIKLLKEDQLPDSLRKIYLAGNSFRCDCNFQLLLKFLKMRQKEYTLETDTTVCHQLPHIQNTLLAEKNCIGSCSCECIKFGNDSFVFLDCSSRRRYSVPHFLNYNSSLHDNEMIYPYSELRYRLPDTIIISPYMDDLILGISLKNNYLTFLHDSQLPPNLLLLYLSNNKLKWLPESIFDRQLNLKQVSLSGNPWICNCYTLKFKKWLTTNRLIIQDINNTLCGVSVEGEASLNGKIIWTLNDSDLCPSNEFVFLLSVSLGVPIAILFCLSATYLYAKYKLNVKVFLYYHGFAFVKEEYMDYNKDFDAFISFSHEDDEFIITEMISEIEARVPYIRLCLHYRHFMPGVLISTNIINAVQNSKMTILLLSRNFLNSEWCLVEFRTAQGQSFEDKLHRLIVVKIGDLPRKMDPSLEAYLKSTTYLTWGETNFWKKLLFVLPLGPTVTNEVPRNAGDNHIFSSSFSQL